MTLVTGQLLTAARTALVFSILLGIGYPLLLLGVGRLGLERQAHGTLLDEGGRVVGSALIAQEFDGAEWFQPRPSASGYDAQASGGTNAGPNDAELAAAIERRRAEIADRDGVPPSLVPPDAITSSGSGLDPSISPGYARIQVDRVARARRLPTERVGRLVEAHVLGRTWGFLGQPRVNVVELNLALRELG